MIIFLLISQKTKPYFRGIPRSYTDPVNAIKKNTTLHDEFKKEDENIATLVKKDIEEHSISGINDGNNPKQIIILF